MIAIVVLAAAAMVVVPKINEMERAVELIVQIVIAILLWKILSMSSEMGVLTKAAVAALTRSEFNTSCLGGMQIQRMMQVCDKITMVERRMMAAQADPEDFLRILRSEILGEEWTE